MIRRFRLGFSVLGVIFLSGSGLPAFAAPEEIQVYLDDINRAGEFGLEFHSNYVASGATIPAYPGAQAPAHVLRVTPEFSYGLTDNWELGAYLLTSLDGQGRANADGEKVRIKYIAPKADGQGYFWGGNLELGKVARRIDDNPWNAELKGILGARSGRWMLAANSNIAWTVSGPQPAPATFNIDAKLAYSISETDRIGIETYSGLGTVRHLGHLNQQAQSVYGVFDTLLAGFDLNFGIGHSLSSVSDRWVVKAIVGVPWN